jgi:hypothetical protein
MSERELCKSEQKLDHEQRRLDASKISATLSGFLTSADFIPVVPHSAALRAPPLAAFSRTFGAILSRGVA